MHAPGSGSAYPPVSPSGSHYTLYNPHVRGCRNSTSPMRCLGNFTSSTVGASGGRTRVLQRDETKRCKEDLRYDLGTHCSRPAIKLNRPSSYAARLLCDGTLRERCRTHEQLSRKGMSWPEPLLPCAISGISPPAFHAISVLYRGPCS